jgi:MFS transporter, FSR family, fosmidomycin resistance protein
LKNISSNLIVYGIAHGLVDAMCAGVLFSLSTRNELSITLMSSLFLIYNVLAFGSQVIFGFIFDYFKYPKLAAILGIVFTASATIIFIPFPVVAIILMGTGNALFHIGGGIISLNLIPGKAVAPGIFVAPGAIGLLCGTLLGKNGDFSAWPFLFLTVVFVIGIFLTREPSINTQQSKYPLKTEFKFEYIIYLVLFVIAMRSLVGFAVVFPWKSDVNLLIILTLSVVMGKGLGGFLADRFGWTIIAVGSLILSIPLLTLGANIPFLGIIGMFMFNFTMPVTLTIISNLLPGKPGISFGLTTAGLLLGALPSFSGFQTSLNNPLFFSVATMISALVLFVGLRYYNKICLFSAKNGHLENSHLLVEKLQEGKYK